MHGYGSVEYNLERNNAPFSQRPSSEALCCLEPGSALSCRLDITLRYSIYAAKQHQCRTRHNAVAAVSILMQKATQRHVEAS